MLIILAFVASVTYMIATTLMTEIIYSVYHFGDLSQDVQTITTGPGGDLMFGVTVSFVPNFQRLFKVRLIQEHYSGSSSKPV